MYTNHIITGIYTLKKTQFYCEAYCLAVVEYLSFNFYFINYI